MSSCNALTKAVVRVRDKRTLQRLRREAGYRSAKEFAKSIGVPVSTYARYERAGDGPGCGIPLANAWVIADKLGCSIDLVVGREDIDAARPSGIGERADALDSVSREALENFLQFLETKPGAAAPRARG